jgi:hypothetical protein
MIHEVHSANGALPCSFIFADHRGGLFIQDELQYLEYLALCALQQCLPNLPSAYPT